MTTDDINTIRRLRLRAFQSRDDIRQHRRFGNSHGFSLFESLLLNRHASAGLRGSFLKFSVKPISRCADAAIRIVLLRQSVARAEAYELENRCFDILGADL